MSAGVSNFNKAASSAYKSIKTEGMKIFLRIQKLVKQVVILVNTPHCFVVQISSYFLAHMEIN